MTVTASGVRVSVWIKYQCYITEKSVMSVGGVGALSDMKKLCPSQLCCGAGCCQHACLSRSGIRVIRSDGSGNQPASGWRLYCGVSRMFQSCGDA